ncbi:MAG: hypothetical protein ACK4V5_05870, partial [Cyanobium sp.]
LLMRLALTDLYRARWSDQIHEEWITAVLRNRPDLSREQLERTRSLMNAHVRDPLVNGHQPSQPQEPAQDGGGVPGNPGGTRVDQVLAGRAELRR